MLEMKYKKKSNKFRSPESNKVKVSVKVRCFAPTQVLPLTDPLAVNGCRQDF